MMYVVTGLVSALIMFWGMRQYYTQGITQTRRTIRPDGVNVDEVMTYRAAAVYRIVAHKNGKMIFNGDCWLFRGDAHKEYREYMNKYGAERD